MKTENISYLWARCYLRNGVDVRINWFSFWWFHLKLRILFDTLKNVNNEKNSWYMITFINFNIYQINIMKRNSTTYSSVNILMRPWNVYQVCWSKINYPPKKEKRSTWWNWYILLTNLTVKSLSSSGSHDEKHFPLSHDLTDLFY